MTPLELAVLFHVIYERKAAEFNYVTRTETRIFDPESSNGKLMIAVCTEILEIMTSAGPDESSVPQGVGVRELRAALQVVLDQVDYTAGACTLHAMVGAVLSIEALDVAHEALRLVP